jgi:hypothetical protein
MDEPIDEQVARLEDRVERLEALLKEVVHNLPRRPGDPRLDLDAVRAGIQQWVTDYVSLRLQQLVPETCEPVPAADPGERPVGRNNSIRPSGRMVIDMMQAPEHRLPDDPARRVGRPSELIRTAPAGRAPDEDATH